MTGLGMFPPPVKAGTSLFAEAAMKAKDLVIENLKKSASTQKAEMEDALAKEKGDRAEMVRQYQVELQNQKLVLRTERASLLKAQTKANALAHTLTQERKNLAAAKAEADQLVQNEVMKLQNELQSKS